MLAVKILFAAIPAYGHLYPLMPLALASAAAGHDVTVATGPPFLGRLPLPTVLQQPADLDVGQAFGEARRRNPDLDGMDLVIRMFADVTTEAVSGTLVEQFENDRPDLVVYEAMDMGAGIAANLLDIPSVAYAISLTHLGYTMMTPAATEYRRQLWAERDRTPPTGRTLLGSVLLTPSPPSLLPYAGPFDAPRVPIRPVPYAEATAALPEWLTEPKSCPRVYLTLGTVSFGAVEVLRRALDELAQLEVEVLVAVGPDGDPAALGEPGDRLHVERFVDQAAVMEHVDVVVHHGGTGTVLGAAAAGLPQLLMPQGADQFFNLDIMTGVGAALGLPNDRQEPGAIRGAVETLLTDGPQRAASRQLQAEIAAMPAPAELVELLVAQVGGR
jgi:UDP:flavonoid glycosyltransferase YjiC (YdhE family)